MIKYSRSYTSEYGKVCVLTIGEISFSETWEGDGSFCQNPIAKKLLQFGYGEQFMDCYSELENSNDNEILEMLEELEYYV